MNDFDIVESYLESQYLYEINKKMFYNQFPNDLISRINGILNGRPCKKLFSMSPQWFNRLDKIKHRARFYDDTVIIQMLFAKEFGNEDPAL